jgi:TonB family protein
VLFTVGVYLAAIATFVGWRELAPRPVAPFVTPRPTPIPIGPMPTIKIFSNAESPGPGPRIVVRKQVLTMPVLVPDELAEEPIATTTTGSGNGEVTDVPVTDAIGGIDGGGWVVPDPGVFIAVEVEPVLVTMEEPVYPDLAREAGVSGDVLVRVLVGADGFVTQAFVLVSVPMLDEAALTAARTAVFKPALQSGRPVPVWVNVPISFQLHD